MSEGQPKFRAGDKVYWMARGGEKREGEIVDGPFKPGVTYWGVGSGVPYPTFTYVVYFPECSHPAYLLGESSLQAKEQRWEDCPGEHRLKALEATPGWERHRTWRWERLSG